MSAVPTTDRSRDYDHIKATEWWLAPQSGYVQLGQPGQLPLLPNCNRLFTCPNLRRKACLHLNKDDNVPVACDQVQLTGTKSNIAPNDLVSLVRQILGGRNLAT